MYTWYSTCTWYMYIHTYISYIHTYIFFTQLISLHYQYCRPLIWHKNCFHKPTEITWCSLNSSIH